MSVFDHPGYPVAEQAAVTKAATVIEELKEFSPEPVLDNLLIKATVQAAFLIAADEAGISGPAIQLQNSSSHEADLAVYRAIHPLEDLRLDYIATGGDVQQTAWKIVPIARRLYPELSADELAQCPLVRNAVMAAILLLNKGRVSFGNEELMEHTEQEADEIIGRAVNMEFNKDELLDLSVAKDAAIKEAEVAVQLAKEFYPWMKPQELWLHPLVVGNVQRAYIKALQEYGIEIDHSVRGVMRYHVADAIFSALYPKG